MVLILSCLAQLLFPKIRWGEARSHYIALVGSELAMQKQDGLNSKRFPPLLPLVCWD